MAATVAMATATVAATVAVAAAATTAATVAMAAIINGGDGRLWNGEGEKPSAPVGF